MNPLLTVREIAKLLKVSEDWIYTGVEAGLLPHTRLGRLIRFTPEQADEIVAAAARPASTRSAHVVPLQRSAPARAAALPPRPSTQRTRRYA